MNRPNQSLRRAIAVTLCSAFSVLLFAAEPAEAVRAPKKGKGKAKAAAAAPADVPFNISPPEAPTFPTRPEAVGAAVGENKATPVGRIKVADGFKVELIYSVPGGSQGSWVNMCVDPKG